MVGRTHLGLFPRVISQALEVCAFAIGTIWLFQVTLRGHRIITDMGLIQGRMRSLLSAFSDDTCAIGQPPTHQSIADSPLARSPSFRKLLARARLRMRLG